MKEQQKNKLMLPFILNLSFTIFEFVGGVLTNSIALISDSVHDIGDSVSIGISMILQKKSQKKPDETYTYGYHRFSLLGGLISSIVLILGSVIIIFEAVPRLLIPEVVDSMTLIWFAILGVSVNLFAAIKAKKGTSINEKVISLHLFEDAFGWVALLIGAILMKLFSILWIDPVLSILFTLYILKHVYNNLSQIIKVFMEIAPKKPTSEEIRNHLLKSSSVQDVHHIHLWTMDGVQSLSTIHVILKKETTKEEYLKAQTYVHHSLEHLGITHSTIEFEYEDAPCENSDCEDIFSLETNHHHLH